MGCVNQYSVRTQGQNVGRGRVHQGISGVSALDWRNLHRGRGRDRWMVVGDGHCDVWRRGILGETNESRGAPRDSPSIPHSYSSYLRSPVSCSRSPVPNRIHASGFTAASRVGIIAIAFMGPVPAADRIASIHPLREALVQREKTAHSLSPARGRSIRLSLGGGRTRGRENKRGESLPREAPCRWAKHPQITERRARIHPPIPVFPLWGRGATGRKSQPATDIHASMSHTRTVSQQPIVVSGSWQTRGRAPMVRGLWLSRRWLRSRPGDPSPERPSESSFAETPVLSSLWPIALATTAGLSGPRCTRPMVGVSAQCIAHLHRWPPA